MLHNPVKTCFHAKESKESGEIPVLLCVGTVKIAFMKFATRVKETANCKGLPGEKL